MSKLPSPEDWHKYQLKKAKTTRENLSGVNEFTYAVQCQVCLEIIENSDIPWIAGQCCYCWTVQDEAHYWRRWWQFVFGDCRFNRDFRATHKSPSRRALYEIRRVVAMAKPPVGFTVAEIEAAFIEIQKRRFKIILDELGNASYSSDARDQFIEWRELMRPLVEAELVLQMIPKAQAKPKPIFKKKKWVDPNLKQLKLF